MFWPLSVVFLTGWTALDCLQVVLLTVLYILTYVVANEEYRMWLVCNAVAQVLGRESAIHSRVTTQSTRIYESKKRETGKERVRKTLLRVNQIMCYYFCLYWLIYYFIFVATLTSTLYREIANHFILLRICRSMCHCIFVFSGYLYCGVSFHLQLFVQHILYVIDQSLAKRTLCFTVFFLIFWQH